MGKKSSRRRNRPARESVRSSDEWKRVAQPGPLAPQAYPVSEIDERSYPELAQIVGISPHGPDLPQRLVRALADPQRVGTLLGELPVQALLVLEVVAEWGGMAKRELLEEELGHRHPGLDLPVEPLGDMLMSKALCTWGRERSTGAEAVMMLSPCAEVVVPAVVGVSLPDEPPPDDARSQSPREARDMLALATLTAHRRLRLTQSGTIDRTTLKTFAKKLGPDREVIAEALVPAVDLDLLGVRSHDQRLVPDALPLLRYARGELLNGFVRSPRRGALGRAADALPADRWFSQAALERWLKGRIHARRRGFYSVLAPSDAASLRRSGLFETAEVNGATWLRRRDPEASTEWRGDGHVTPSFEVMLGPSSSLEVVAVVGLVAELVRLDHVLTFKLSPASVATGMAAGVAAEDLWRALRAVGPHGLPSNVEALVCEWVDKARVAHLEKGWFLFVSPDDQEQITSGRLAPYVRAVRAPGVVALSGATPRALVDDALAELGIQAGGGALSAAGGATKHDGPLLDPGVPGVPAWRFGEDDHDDLYDDFREADELLGAPHSPSSSAAAGPVTEVPGRLPWPRPDADLRRRVQKGLRDGLEPLTFIRSFGDPLEDARHIVESVRAGAEAQGAPDQVLRWFDALDELWKGRFDEIARWYKRLPESRQTETLEELGFPLMWMPWLVLSEKWRKRALQRKTAQSVIDESERLTRPDRLDPDVMRIAALIADPKVHEWMHAQAEEHGEPGPQPPLHLVHPPGDDSDLP